MAVDLGIDFGTSNTAAAFRVHDGRLEPVLFDGAPVMPSAVFADTAGGLLAGRDAVFLARLVGEATSSVSCRRALRTGTPGR